MIGEISAKRSWNRMVCGRPMKASPRGRPSRDARLVLPHALDGAKGPAEALPGELAEALRRFGPGDRALVVGTRQPAALDRDGQVLVLGERVGRIAADIDDRLLTPGADSAGHDGHRSQPSEGAPLEILRGDIFQRLPSRDDVDAVADLGVAGDGGKLLIRREPAREPRDRVRLELSVGVERDDDLAPRERQTVVQRARLAAIVELQQAALARRRRTPARRSADGAILRAVVDHDDVDGDVARSPALARPTARSRAPR